MDISELLAQLVNKSLVLAEWRGAETRYRMLETIREYALEKLRAAGEMEALRARHLDFFVSFAEEAEPQLHRARQVEWLECLEADLDNLRAALEWACAAQAAPGAMRLAAALNRFWSAGSHLAEGRQWLAAALAREDAPAATPARAAALIAAGALATNAGDYAQARALLEQGLALWRQFDDKARISNALCYIGSQAYHDGRYDLALARLQEGLALARELGDEYLMARNLWAMSRAAAAKQEPHAARYIQESLALHRAIGNDYGTALILADLTVDAGLAHDYSQAIARGEEALALFQKLKDNRLVAWAESTVGDALSRSGDYGRGIALLRKGLKASQDAGDKATMVDILSNLGPALCAAGQPVKGTQLLAASAAAMRALEMVYTPDGQVAFDEDVHRARAQLGADDFARAWSAGSALTLEQALELALSEAVVNGWGKRING